MSGDGLMEGLGSLGFYGADNALGIAAGSVGKKQVTPETIDNRVVSNSLFKTGERVATTKQVRAYKKQMKRKGISVVVDRKRKILYGNKAAGFDYSTGTIYIQKKPAVLDLLHEGYHAEQYLSLGQKKYAELKSLEREEYVYSQIIKNSNLFNEAELKLSEAYIIKLRREGRNNG